jgi:hypothetical protein
MYLVILLLAIVAAVVIAVAYMQTRSRMGPDDFRHNEQDDVSAYDPGAHHDRRN